MTAASIPTDPSASSFRPFTPEEQHLRHQAQQRLLQRRINAQGITVPQTAARLKVPSFAQTVLLTVVPPSPAPCSDAAGTIPASVEAAMERIRHPKAGTPAALAVAATERARPLIEASIRRREARHNALTVMRVLTQAAYTLIQARGQSQAHTTTYTYFTVLDLLPVVTGLSSDQCERATRRLQELGLIHKSAGAIPTGAVAEVLDNRGNPRQRKVYRGGTWTRTSFLNEETGEYTETTACAGSWVAVLLHPAEGRTARVIAHELPPCPRDLTADRKAGRTAWQAQQEAKTKVRESRSLTGNQFDITPLVNWSLPKKENSKLLGTVDSRTSVFEDALTPQDLVWSLSRIVSTHPQGRREAVQEGAARLVSLLHDPGWERHYYRILWRATEAEFRGVPAYAQLASALERTLIAGTELHLVRPGAWLTRQLNDCGWMDAVYHGTGTAPGVNA
jgi:hypothetical protein